MTDRDSNGRFVKGSTIGTDKRFKKGNIPWNKGTTGLTSANKTSFSREKIEEKYKDIEGTPKYYERDGYITTISERVPVKSHNGKIYMHRRRIPYARYVLSQAGIDVPKGCIVYHKDGDNTNNELENLEVITRAELIRRNRGND